MTPGEITGGAPRGSSPRHALLHHEHDRLGKVERAGDLPPTIHHAHCRSRTSAARAGGSGLLIVTNEGPALGPTRLVMWWLADTDELARHVNMGAPPEFAGSDGGVGLEELGERHLAGRRVLWLAADR